MAKRPKTKLRPHARAPKPVADPAPRALPAAIRERKPFDWLQLLGVVIVVAAVFGIYWPAVNGTWLWDDDYLLQKNELIHDSDGLLNIWFAPTTLIDYFPLTVSLEWLEWQFWPDNPFCYHLTNIIFHSCSALLIWHLLSKLGLRFAWFGGLLFAIHPVMVESVAWMAEIKNTTSMPPFLLAACAWIDFDRNRRSEYYYLSLFSFLTAMLCKTTMVMFPVVILLYAWWKHDRITWRDLLRSAPFFAISLALGIALILLLRHGVGEETIPLGGVGSRLACAGTSLVFYFSRCFLPIWLMPIYPQWQVNPPALWEFTPWLLFGGAFYWLWTRRQPWARHLLFGLGFFLINLVPFVGFRPVSFMRFAWVMDHIIYLPMIGLLGLAVAALGQADAHLGAARRPYLFGALGVLALFFFFGSRDYAGSFVSSQAQWSHEVQCYPSAWPAHNNLGNALSDAGQLDQAAHEYQAALQLNPGYPEAHNNLGIIYARTGHIPEAEYEFQQALRYCPDLQSAKENLARMQAWTPPKKN